MKQLIKLLLFLVLTVSLAYAVPAKPNAPDLSSGSDNGNSSTDNRTSLTSLTFTGTKALNETIRLYRNGSDTNITDSSDSPSYSLTYTGETSGTKPFTVTADANDGTGESTQSNSLSVDVILSAAVGTVVVDDITADNTINLVESGQNITIITGSASGGDISVGDNVTMSINGNTYTTTVLSDTFWNVSVSGADLAAVTNFTVYVDSTDEFGHSASSSTYHSHSVDTTIGISFYPILAQIDNSYNDGIFVEFNTDIEAGNPISFKIDGNLSFTTTTKYKFIPNSELTSLTDGATYTIETDASLSDNAGNIIGSQSTTFKYDKVGDTKEYSLNINIGDTIDGNLYDANDIDYFVIDIDKKGLLTFNSTKANIALQTLGGVDIINNGTAKFSEVVDKGTYLLKAYGANTGNYTLSSSIVKYADEIDESVIVKTKSSFDSFGISSLDTIYVNGGILYTNSGNKFNISDDSTTLVSNYLVSSNKIAIDNSIEISVNDGSTIYFNDLSKNIQYSILTQGNGAKSVSLVGETLYILVGDTLELYDVSEIKSPTFTSTIQLQQNIGYDEVIVYKSGVKTYAYLMLDSKDFYVMDITDTGNVSITSIFDNISVNDFAVGEGLLYIASSTDTYIFDIKSDPSIPRLMDKRANVNNYNVDGIAVSDGIVYISAGASIFKYKYAKDFDDNITLGEENKLSKIKLNTTIDMNKYSGKADVDIFRVDLEYSGDLSFTSLGVNASDLNITIDDNSDFSSPELNATDFKNTTVSLTNLSAKTYYIKIDSSDINSFDNYTLQNTFTKNNASDAPDALLNIHLARDDAKALNVVISGSLVANDIDLYKIDLPADGDLNIAQTGVGTVGVYSADINATSSYATLTDVNTSLTVSAGAYYIKASGGDGAYTITPNFTSFGDTDEYKQTVVIEQVEPFTGIDTQTNMQSISGKFVYSPSLTRVYENSSTLYNSIKSKSYLSQISDDKYIYAIYKFQNPLDSSYEFGIDIFEYINRSNKYIVATKIISGVTDDTFEFKLKYEDSKVLLREESGWFEYNFDDLTNITKGATLFLASSYIDFEVDGNSIYAVDLTKIDILDKTSKTISKTKNISDISSLEYDANLIYVATSTSGIKGLNKSDLSFVKDIVNIRNIVSLEKIGNKLYALEEQSRDSNIKNRRIRTIKLKKDFSDDFANAYKIYFDTDVTGYIAVANEVDIFKIELDKSSSLNTSLDNGSCELFSSTFTSLGSCTNAGLSAGNYYLKVTHNAITPYTLNVSKAILYSDISDTLKFYDGENTTINDANVTFSSKIDIANDVDYHKITLDTTGLLTLDGNSTLVYENGDEVSKDGSKYNIIVSGEYFIKVVGDANATYDINASFESIVDDKSIDNTTTENTLISTLAINGDSSKMISSGDIIYLVDEVDGLSIIDLSDVNNPLITSRVNLEGTPEKLYLDGTILYVALGNDGIAIIDVSDKDAVKLYSQTLVNDSVNSLVSIADKVYLACNASVIKLDVSKPTKPVISITKTTYSNVKDILINDAKLLIADSSGVLKINTTDLSTISSSSPLILSAQRLLKDSRYIFVQDNLNITHILNSDLTDTAKSIDGSNTVINDMYINNKILYISTSTGYKVVEYKDIDFLNISSVETGTVNSMTLSNNSLLLSKPKVLNIRDAVPDYTDTLTGQGIIQIDISSTDRILGQFSKNGDVDTFKYINVDYTGTLDINLSANDDVNITLYTLDGDIIDSSLNHLSVVVNSGEFFIQIKSDDNLKEFSYDFIQNFVNDGTLDILDANYNNEEFSTNDEKNGNLYSGGKDKDYFKLVVTQRGKITFNTNGDDKVKVSLLYKSGTVIASNYDKDDASIKSIFDADLAIGEYFVKVENADESYTQTHNYKITSSFGSTGEVVMDSGVSDVALDNVAAYAHSDKYSYMLKDGTIHRMSNILEPEFSYKIDALNGDYKMKMFVYKEGIEDLIEISKIDTTDSINNTAFVLRYDPLNRLFSTQNEISLDGLSDEEVMLIDESGYIYYYDEDSLYISSLNDTNLAQQLALDELKIVKVSGNYMYVVTSSFIQIVDISVKDDIDDSKILQTINRSNVKSIYVDENRLFVGVADKLQVYDISDKTSSVFLNEVNIGFNDKDLWYQGTPSSIYLLKDKIYTTVEGVGIVIFNIDTFNDITISSKALNLGENLSSIYTFHGDAINYIVANELKAYFLSKQLLDADGAGTYTIVEENSIAEGSSSFEGCFIATAAYGSYFDENVKVLRGFRDSYLLQNELGRIFVDYYYATSPSVAKSIVDNEFAKGLIRTTLTPIVYVIKYPAILAGIMLMLLILAYRRYTIKFTKKLGSI